MKRDHLNEYAIGLMKEAGYAAPELAARAQILVARVVEACMAESLRNSLREDDMGAIISANIYRRFYSEKKSMGAV